MHNKMNNIPIFISPSMRSYISVVFAVFFFLLVEISHICMSLPCISRENEALLKFKATLHDPSNRLSSWKGENLDASLLQLEYLSYLDLNGNDFYGSTIPNFIGSMRRLTYLSLSNAHFGGRVPTGLGNLTSLQLLDLSGVDLGREHDLFQFGKEAIGPVPTDNQFLTYEPSTYAANPYLCGHELQNKCPGDDFGEVPETKVYEDGKSDKEKKLLLYSVIAAGFGSGFWGVIGVLIVKKSWRYACLRWVEDAMDDIYVAVVIKVAKLKKWYVRNYVDG
ncbi:putative transferase [Lupinus albus]|uniref:Putative transferase n=1 Tax=Lupinus albus TaxID=3870 RepID=A0A6A4NJA2_LUPAL|nr:putative transferase [Lupinus albus]